jgi:D-sedoheptulose 7-phosphate isomerase
MVYPNQHQNKSPPRTNNGDVTMSENRIKDHLISSAEVKTKAAEACAASATQAAVIIADCLKAGGKLMLCGNGGSAGDAQHIAAEFIATLDHQRPRPGLRALALTTDTSFLTAYSNDFGYEGIFARQVETLGDQGDVLVGISTSGNSKNVCVATSAAKVKGITTIAMTGKTGGALAELADHLIAVPAAEIPLIQECHIALGHAITAEVEILLGYSS